MNNTITTSRAPEAIGPYSQGIQSKKDAFSDGIIFTSGQIPFDPDTGLVAGDTMAIQTEQSLKNVQAVLTAAGASLLDVVKVTVFIRDMGRFAEMNEVYSKYFNSKVLPARSCVEVSKLPKDVLVEIEAIAIK